MKGLRGYILISFVCVFLVLSGTCLYKHFCKAQSLYLIFDPLCSESLQRELSEYLAIQGAQLCPYQLCDYLKIFNNTIKAITYHRKNDSVSFLMIDLFDPLFKVNHDEVMLESGAFAKRSDFVQNSFESLYHLSIVQECNEVDTNALIRWLAKSSSQLFDFFSVHFKNPTEIKLIDKNKERFSIFCNYETVLSDELLERCMIVLQNTQATADLRFKNQMILSSKKKGGHNEGKYVQ